jgi:hypothetical protein
LKGKIKTLEMKKLRKGKSKVRKGKSKERQYYQYYKI